MDEHEEKQICAKVIVFNKDYQGLGGEQSEGDSDGVGTDEFSESDKSNTTDLGTNESEEEDNDEEDCGTGIVYWRNLGAGDVANESGICVCRLESCVWNVTN
ncbi:MAG: hypothetical protein EZS28_011083 [Streblomastix strix]|uniref:Uncharacterized protein n=1 Tax=Streblomastix strix TaxID=222440 RepID=A0A5J4WEV0_9EUKA|nr:MAG: hypothetical protein EZS28_011083 [Streblomastix strix]